jgi:hypothetical protein
MLKTVARLDTLVSRCRNHARKRGQEKGDGANLCEAPSGPFRQISPVPFFLADVPWATSVSRDHIDLKSDHTWEYGHHRDMIGDAEEIRDYHLRAVYGTFATVKRRFPKAATNLELTRVNHVAARGESRRLMGDHILTENDIKSKTPFADAMARGSLVFCLHYPRKDHDFRNNIKLTAVEPYHIPFRCLYSRNIDNLMMAGRNVSATHIAYSSIKLMKTGGHMGVATGAAAYLCNKYDTTPRDVYQKAHRRAPGHRARPRPVRRCPLTKKLDCARRHQAGEMLKRPVVGPFCIIGKATAGKLSALQMIAEALAADPFPRTGVVTAVTGCHIPSLIAFHDVLLREQVAGTQ